MMIQPTSLGATSQRMPVRYGWVDPLVIMDHGHGYGTFAKEKTYEALAQSALRAGVEVVYYGQPMKTSAVFGGERIRSFEPHQHVEAFAMVEEEANRRIRHLEKRGRPFDGWTRADGDRLALFIASGIGDRETEQKMRMLVSRSKFLGISAVQTLGAWVDVPSVMRVKELDQLHILGSPLPDGSVGQSTDGFSTFLPASGAATRLQVRPSMR